MAQSKRLVTSLWIVFLVGSHNDFKQKRAVCLSLPPSSQNERQWGCSCRGGRPPFLVCQGLLLAAHCKAQHTAPSLLLASLLTSLTSAVTFSDPWLCHLNNIMPWSPISMVPWSYITKKWHHHQRFSFEESALWHLLHLPSSAPLAQSPQQTLIRCLTTSSINPLFSLCSFFFKYLV